MLIPRNDATGKPKTLLNFFKVFKSGFLWLLSYKLIVGADTLRTTDSTSTLRTTAVVGDTMRLQFYAENWPEVVGYTITIGHTSRSKGTTTFEPGPFLKASGLPTTAEGFVDLGVLYQIGQVSLGDSRGSGSGLLGTMTAIWNRSGDEMFNWPGVDVVIIDSIAVETRTQRVPGYFLIFVEVAELEIKVTADLNGNGVVDFDDFLAFAKGFGKNRITHFDFDSRLDFDGDNVVGFNDFLLLAADFGKPPTVFRLSRRK